MLVSRRRFISLVVGSFATASSPLAFSKNIAAESYVSELGQRVLGLARNGNRGDKVLQAQFANLLKTYISMPGIANFALGTARSKLPAEQKDAFYDLVANYAAALFVWYVDDFKGANLEITGSNVQGKFITVESRIDGDKEPLRWRVSSGPAEMRIVDVNVKGIWLSIAMKKMFEDTLRASNGNFQPLFAKLREAETW